MTVSDRGHFVLSAEDRQGNIWVVRTDDLAGATHVAELFRLNDHVRVTITAPDEPLDID